MFLFFEVFFSTNMSYMRSLFVAAEKFPKLNDDSRNFKIRGKRLHLGGSMILKTASEKKQNQVDFLERFLVAQI